MREEQVADVGKELLKAEVETTLKCIIADDSLISCGEDDTSALTTLLETQRQISVQDQLCLVVDLGSGGAVIVELCLCNFSLHDCRVFLLALWDQRFQQSNILLAAPH
jgi:hypothetical protein